MEMINVETNFLNGPALDWLVAESIGLEPIPGQPPEFRYWKDQYGNDQSGQWLPSTDWSQGGPLIDEYRVVFLTVGGNPDALAAIPHDKDGKSGAFRGGKTRLCAAMRAIVAMEIGKEAEVPQDLWDKSR